MDTVSGDIPDQTHKVSYTIPCSSSFRDAVTELALRRHSNVADLARSVLLLLSEEVVRKMPDPGGPPPGDREQTVLKSGPSEGRPWRRKPRLQVRLAPGYDVSTVRRALALALALDRDERSIAVHSPNEPQEPDPRLKPLTEEVERLHAAVAALAFRPLSAGVRTRSEALHILGFAPGELPDRDTIRARFRVLATVHHPDSATGNHLRMSQLNAALALLNSPR
jgi:hypothetical protein